MRYDDLILMGAVPRLTSKRAEPFKGKVLIGPHSSFRKLARALRRGKVPDERPVVIDEALRAAEARWYVYANTKAHGAPRWA